MISLLLRLVFSFLSAIPSSIYAAPDPFNVDDDGVLVVVVMGVLLLLLLQWSKTWLRSREIDGKDS